MWCSSSTGKGAFGGLWVTEIGGVTWGFPVPPIGGVTWGFPVPPISRRGCASCQNRVLGTPNPARTALGSRDPGGPRGRPPLLTRPVSCDRGGGPAAGMKIPR
jgi:hypothetical protein